MLFSRQDTLVKRFMNKQLARHQQSPEMYQDSCVSLLSIYTRRGCRTQWYVKILYTLYVNI